MTEEMKMQKAKEVFYTIIKMMDKNNWKYESSEEKLLIKSALRMSDDSLPTEFFFVVKPKQEVVVLFSSMPFNMPEDKRVDGAMAVCTASYGLVAGSFDYDLRDGEIRFRMTSRYKESTLSESLFESMLVISIGTINKYQDKFYMIAKGLMTVQQFIKEEQG